MLGVTWAALGTQSRRTPLRGIFFHWENKKSPLMAALSLVNTNFESIKLQPL